MKLRRVLGTGDAAWLVAGSMIGAGIFSTPGFVAERLPGGTWPLLAWGFGGLLALCGAAVYAELGSRIPRAGGDYQYLNAAFGPLWGFLTGWAAFLLSFSGAVAVMVLVSKDYFQRAVPALGVVPTPIAVAVAVLLLIVANNAGAKVSGRATLTLTAVPVLGLIGIFGYGLVADRDVVAWPAPPAAPASGWAVAFGAALVPVFFTYTGWNAAAYVAGEIRDPARSLARALLIGTAGVAVLYLVFNAVLLATVPSEDLAGATAAGAIAAQRLLGPVGERWLSLTIAIAVLGTANVTLMAGSRIYYAMAADGLGPAALARVNRAGAPSAAIWVSGIWTAVLAMLAGVRELVDLATLSILLLSSLTVSAIFVLRHRDPDGAPYRCPGYPVVPIVYLVVCLGVAVANGLYAPKQALIGAAIVAAGVPAFVLFRRSGRSRLEL